MSLEWQNMKRKLEIEKFKEARFSLRVKRWILFNVYVISTQVVVVGLLLIGWMWSHLR